MCPPAQPVSPAEIDLYWSDEHIILFLDECTPEFHLPNNVLADPSPYQYLPSNLPEGIWHLVHSNEEKDSGFGFWKAKGEACKVYTNSAIIGWRTTLEYFEGKPPHGQRTDWLMQEYRITQKEVCDKNKPKEPRSLCRVFLCNGSSSNNELHFKNCKTAVGSKQINSAASIIPDTNNTSGKDSTSESKAKRECEVGLLPLADRMANSSPQDFSELECFSRGDYLELNDLEDRESHSSSSQNSSCPSKSSDEYFDSSVLLWDLEEEVIHMQGKHSSSRYNFTSSGRSNGVIMAPASSGSMSTGAGITSVNEKLTDKRVLEHTTRWQISDTRNEGTSNFSNAVAPSTSHVNAISNGEKKVFGAGRMKKLMLYFCFTLL